MLSEPQAKCAGAVIVRYMVLNTILSKGVSEKEHAANVSVMWSFAIMASYIEPRVLANLTGQSSPWNIYFLLNDDSVKKLCFILCQNANLVSKRLSNEPMQKTRQHFKQAAKLVSTWFNRQGKPVEFTVGETASLCPCKY
jgi:hypothetical protein